MSSRYSKRHYEDVAEILKRQTAPVSLVNEFVGLFAADNPGICSICKQPSGEIISTPDLHIFEGGFDRERFLAACGLEVDHARR